MNTIRRDWTVAQAESIYNSPFLDLTYGSAKAHRQNFDSQEVQVCTLLSIKTGGGPKIVRIVHRLPAIIPT